MILKNWYEKVLTNGDDYVVEWLKVGKSGGK
jgi:hypothetical protein